MFPVKQLLIPQECIHKNWPRGYVVIDKDFNLDVVRKIEKRKATGDASLWTLMNFQMQKAKHCPGYDSKLRTAKFRKFWYKAYPAQSSDKAVAAALGKLTKESMDDKLKELSNHELSKQIQ